MRPLTTWNQKDTDVGVFVDSTWQRKGFLSAFGVVTATSIDSGKVLDVAILEMYCNNGEKLPFNITKYLRMIQVII